jgi:2-polyprenyl-3-methyl-5-hydroxy-6-metoxy-1,4-benzoquinol methylase
MEPYVEANKRAWDHESKNGNIWTDGCSSDAIEKARSGDIDIVLSPFRRIPPAWLGDVVGKKILCLACGGGQQGVLLAASGAKVTVFDISPRQVEQDRKIAREEGIPLEAMKGNMLDLSRFSDGQFDMVYNPTSSCFVDDVESVYRQCNRILKDGGMFFTSVTNPILYMFDEKKALKGKLKVKYTIPYSDLASLSQKQVRRMLERMDTLEFSHTLDSLLGGICRSGFAIMDLYTDGSGFEMIDSFVHDCYLAVRAQKAR